MSGIFRHRTHWTGFTGAPGVTTTYWDIPPVLSTLRTFFSACAGLIYNNATLTFDSIVDELDETDGSLLDSQTVTAVATLNGTGVGSYAGPVGLACDWITGQVHDGRRVVGRTFLVPGKVGSTNGVPPAGDLTTITNAGIAMLATAGPKLLIWHRPKFDTKVPKPHPLIRPGVGVQATTAVAVGKYVTLRSRRD